jgi:hypothetical protein
MLLSATVVVLALWLAFVWFCDPDGFRAARIAKSRTKSN